MSKEGDAFYLGCRRRGGKEEEQEQEVNAGLGMKSEIR